ncbi:peptidoglycan DD-metalloendopeptidase family protein [Rossellomorea marisflavi]|uniref:peptidoglycan DD-metalloendopeptidase family protein n=1 Tax=Rossellomorea marisflavi TaxID=189381 RepID=UPI00279FFD62|nr:peptidoglycan DD-metalloendopeptidase family protein [Rossellomorea marisflavi]UTE74522.1 peptidoglycan DD-metalloendopeptidase family protein [Rossellomorea marisflavi]
MIADYGRRLLIVIVLALCVGMIFMTGRVAKAESDSTAEWRFPVDGTITDVFGSRSGTHKGMDIGGEEGSPVHSVADGVVTRSYLSDSYGHVVFVRHDNGYETVYAHLISRGVKEGQEVHRGELVGKLGNTGISTGPHLHFEIHAGEWTFEKENAIDPFVVFGQGGVGQVVFAEKKDPYQTVAASQVAGDSYRVKKGDTLWSISHEHGLTVDDLKKWNGLKDSTIAVGQELSLREDSYQVEQGDTLYSIAVAHGIELDKLLAANDLRRDSPIYPSQTLRIH